MQRILAIAVGSSSDKSPAVVRGVIKGERVKELRPYIAGLIKGLERLRHRGGESFEIDYVTGEPQGLKKLVKAAIDETKPDAIFAMSTSALNAAMSVTKDIPIVFPSISDPIEDGVVKSCAAPGTNATGIRAMRRQTADECLELFKATVPSLRKVYALHKPNYGPATRAMTALKRAAKRANYPEKITSYWLRHSLATHMLEKGAWTREVHHQLTHSSLELIERYAKVTRRGLSRVMSKIA